MITQSNPFELPLKCLAALAGLFVLTGCFVSETRLIGAGQAVLPIDGPITMCLEETDPCFEMQVSNDGYVTAPRPDGEQGQIRFSPLVQAAQRQVFIAEAQGDNEALIYLLARRALHPAPGAPSFELAGVACSDLPAAVREDFERRGGVHAGGIITNCTPPSLEVLKHTLIEGFGADLGDPDWWLENGPNG